MKTLKNDFLIHANFLAMILKAHRQISKEKSFENIVHMIKHANFQI